MTGVLDRARAALTGRYELKRLLGEGGMAEVFLADDPRHGRQVAVKVLKPELAARLGSERFLREVRLAAGLSHPHVLPLHDSGEADGLLYSVMPFVEGPTLAELLAQSGPLSVEESLRIGRALAQALGHAHAHGVIHRDVKTGNVLMADGEPMLADFGLARSAAPEDVALTQVGDALGTPLTMSPEQAGGQATDTRSDVYSLGCVLFEMLSGRPPFQGRSAQELLARHREDAPPRLAALRADTPPALDELVARCLAKQPGQRPADGNAVAAQLDALLRQLRTGSARVEAARGARRWTWIAAALVVVLGVALGFVLRDRARRAWIDEQGLPELQAASEAEDWERAMDLAHEIEAIDPEHAQLAQLWDTFSGTTELLSDPPGARVSRRPLSDPDAEWIVLGDTPLELRLPHGFHRLRFELEGYQPTEIASHWYYLRGQTTRLAPEGEGQSGMLLVPGGRVVLNIPGLDHLAEVELGNALMQVHEVTNAEYARFIEAGGYDDSSYWTEPFVQAGRELDFAEAMAQFVDATGRPGPATWVAGDHAEGQANHPVSGVSWYEAAAYCAWSGRSLPTVHHWNRAAETRLSAMVVPPSNFDGQGTVEVGSREAISAFGLHDLAGNVREWCLNATSDGLRAILGGGFDDLPYMFNDFFAQDPWDRSPSNGFRTALPLEPSDAAVTGVLDAPFRDFRAEQPATDEVFAVYRGLYDYDPLPLDATVELRDEAHDDYVAERVSYTLPYGDERGSAWLYLPKRGTGPFPCVVIFPGSNAIHAEDSSGLLRPRFAWLMRQGYAVLHPIYLGTYERGTELASDYPDESQLYRDHVIAWGMDVRRAVDLLEQLPECDASRLAYLGTSWGGALGPILLAIEPRFDVAALYVAGMLFQHSRPEVDQIHYVPRVTLPVLMLNGAYDHFFPVETSQQPLFELLGTPTERKKYVLAEGGHYVPREMLISEVLAWFERWLGD
ncbi:MAG: protein kinase [Planctomycetes bacterium]|nr:protein kinase [Planctomycetota bacterium]